MREKLVSRLHFDVDQDRAKPGFAKYVPEPPSEVIRLGLESEIERTKKPSPIRLPEATGTATGLVTPLAR
jgi:hypothetical protein